MEINLQTKGVKMQLELWIYFFIVFLGLQGLYQFSKKVSLTMLSIGNILILQYSFTNHEFELLVLTLLMMTAQITRIFWGEE